MDHFWVALTENVAGQIIRPFYLWDPPKHDFMSDLGNWYTYGDIVNSKGVYGDEFHANWNKVAWPPPHLHSC